MEIVVRDLTTMVDTVYQSDKWKHSALYQQCHKPQRNIVFITGNLNKVREMGSSLSSERIKLDVHKLDLKELQDSTVLNVAGAKCREAYEILKSKDGHGDTNQTSVLVEDTSLHFSAFNGLPGPYVKWFVDAMGPEGLNKMLAGFDDKSAQATCTYALMDDESRIVFCQGTVRGKIVAPRGESWGWDPVFEEETTGLTFAEMDAATKSKLSHRHMGLRALREFLDLN